MKTNLARAGLAVVWAATLAFPPLLPVASAAQPAVTPQQLEADWLRQLELRLPAGRVRPAGDAGGGRRGGGRRLKDGKWGFHTENEKEPWWQVDLGTPQALDRVLLFNRCDGGFAARNGQIRVLLSEDGKEFRQAYQHDGTVFLGPTGRQAADGGLEPAAGALSSGCNCRARATSTWTRSRSTRVGGPANIALKKPATQSSVSQWSKRRTVRPRSATSAAAAVVERGLKLAEDLRQRGVAVDAARCDQVCRNWPQLPAAAAGADGRSSAAVLPAPATRTDDGPGQPAAGLRQDPVRQTPADAVPAHVRPALRLVVASGRRRLPAGELPRRSAHACGA